MGQNSYNANGTWTAPTNLKNNTVKVEVWGGGGGGALSNNANTGASGGGGGAYSVKNVTVVPGNTYSFNVGANGLGGSNNTSRSGQAGGWSGFNANEVYAEGGKGGVGGPGNAGGAGGDANNGVGDTKYSGGAGYTVAVNTKPGGGGGAAGGNAAAGNNATSQTGATGAGGGGNGGNGGNNNTAGNDGSLPGGGGGGSGNRTTGTKLGGTGSTGLVIITWTTPTFNDWRQDVINGLNSAQSEQYGWQNEVRAKIPVTDVVRSNNTVATITLSAEAAYDITAQEVITAILPGGIVTSGNNINVTPTFTISAGGNAPAAPTPLRMMVGMGS